MAYHDRLPVLVAGDVQYTPLLRHVIVPVIMAGYALAFVFTATLTRASTITNLWIRVVMVALFSEVAAGGLIGGGRFTVGWYVGLAEGAVAALTFLVVMLGQVNEVLIAFAVSNRTLAEENVRDHLTDLLNRRGFDSCMADVFGHMRRMPMPIALLIVDIDCFKIYNDHFGHVRGDEALRSVAFAMAAAMNRSRDSCSRIGGEEFAVVLPATDEDGAIVVAERVRRAIAALGIAQAPQANGAALTVSIGVAATERDPDCNAQVLYERADTALYEAKRLGRNRLARYSLIARAA
jgi:diguanylate cyclase (GGDEF)-like protein